MNPIISRSAIAGILLLPGLLDFPAFLPAAGQSPARTTARKGIVVLVQFPDVRHNVSREFALNRFNQGIGSYVKEMSYGAVSLTVDATPKWYTLPRTIRDYRISSRNLEVDKSRVKRLIDDALRIADKDVDFSKYDFTAVFMGAQQQDYGMIGLCGYPGMLGWVEEGELRTPGRQVVKGGVAIFCYQAHLGTLFHDVAHVLGGVKDGKRVVPCLYDHDLQAKPGSMREVFVDSLINMGFWDPMSCHYSEWGVPPMGSSSWTRIRLNWIDPSRIKVIKPGETAEITLGPLASAAADFVAIRIPLSDSTSYLIENRQPVGFDRYLRGSGVLIMRADDRIAECRHGESPVRLVNANPEVPHLEGAAFDLGKKSVFEDRKNRIRIELKEKTGAAYRVRIGEAMTAYPVPSASEARSMK
jgi:M6 family metalloprotease-like protein